jgi:hypothetical protein
MGGVTVEIDTDAGAAGEFVLDCQDIFGQSSRTTVTIEAESPG